MASSVRPRIDPQYHHSSVGAGEDPAIAAVRLLWASSEATSWDSPFILLVELSELCSQPRFSVEYARVHRGCQNTRWYGPWDSPRASSSAVQNAQV